ncbi:MAG: PHP domain-containing protein [Clostridia bacterium]|nr:PHP domain-containing protein [Clostridia bacterium]
MRYVVDHDLHIHSMLSECSSDPEQTSERILAYAEEKGLKTVCLTNHFWDEAVPGASDWYEPQNYKHIASAKPLPQSKDVRFLFGCETELDKDMTLGLSKEKYDLFDFIIIPTTHLHFIDFTLSKEDAKDAQSIANAWVRRIDAVLGMDLPFHKVGIAHMTCNLIAPTREEHIEVLKLIPDSEMERLFTKAAKLGVGIEINSHDINFADEEPDVVLRPYKIAKKCGCKFYLGSDSHHPDSFDPAIPVFEKAVDLLGLTEDDKFIIPGI